ncbi:hypothetical protein K3495_g14332, partial [Podosphaera aphanis]
QEEQNLMRRARLWKSIIFSSIGKNAYPYCLYIRILHLKNLDYLLRDLLLADCENFMHNFFEAETARFTFGIQLLPSKETLKGFVLGRRNVVKLIGDIIIAYADNAVKKLKITSSLERLSWMHLGNTPINWISQLSNLKTLQLEDVCSFHPDLAKAIMECCPKFCNLKLKTYPLPSPEEIAFFFQELKKNTLKKLHLYLYSECDDNLLLALNHHAESIIDLKISCSDFSITSELYLLWDCKILTSLQLSTPAEVTENEPPLASPEWIADWISSCRSLRGLSIGDLDDGVAILTHVFTKERIRLQKLALHGLKFVETEKFTKALSTQTSLEYLNLSAQKLQAYITFLYLGVHQEHEMIDNLTCSLVSLTELKHLHLCLGHEFCHMDSIIHLVSHLLKLEKFSFYSRACTDEIWPAMANLRLLNALTIEGFCKFSLKGVLGFIDTLHATNKGMKLKIFEIQSHFHGRITLEHESITQQKSIISQLLYDKVRGSFEITPFCYGK